MGGGPANAALTESHPGLFSRRLLPFPGFTGPRRVYGPYTLAVPRKYPVTVSDTWKNAEAWEAGTSWSGSGSFRAALAVHGGAEQGSLAATHPRAPVWEGGRELWGVNPGSRQVGLED